MSDDEPPSDELVGERPVEVSRLPPVAPAASAAAEMRERLGVAWKLLLLGILLIFVGLFKPLTPYVLPAFPWIFLGLGLGLFLLTLLWLFDVREFMRKTDEKKLAYIFGVVFVVMLLAVALFVPNPTAFQYTVFRIVLALAAAGVAAMIPGFLEVTISTWLRAGGALAIFVIVYFYAPAALAQLH
jgi:hypothetical protein